ncbi:serine beta-lactamase-like protein LACTB, mitochondrial isoform 2-T2 [Rhynchonycteris naso]
MRSALGPSGVNCSGLSAVTAPSTPCPSFPFTPQRLNCPPGLSELVDRWLARDTMYRLPSVVTTRAATPGGWAWGCGRRGAHHRAGLPPFGPGWVGGLGLGLGLALGVKLAGELRGASPAPPPATPDSEGSPQAEPPPPPPDQALASWSLQTPTPPTSRRYARAIDNSRDLLHRIKDEVGAPGIVVGVSVDGKEIWSEGLGYADVENRVPCKPETVMRIASISKSLTMVALAKLWEAGKLDLDIPVQHYVPEFPEKEYEGEKVSVTTRLLISHLSGIRHYEKDMKKVKEEKAYKALKMMKEMVESDQEKELKEKTGKSNEKNDFAKAKLELDNEAKCRNSKPVKKKNDFEQGELYLKEKFENSIESLRLFKNDPLFFKPDFMFTIKRNVLSTHLMWITPINGLVVDFCLQWATF